MTRYVTLAYGDAPGVYRQSLMLLLSLVAHAPEPYELVVATDRPDCYVWFGTRVEIEYLDAARLEAWRGPEPFSMRQKLELIRAAAVPSREAIVLLDADVLARKPLDAFVDQPPRRRAVHAQAGVRPVAEPPKRQPEAVGVAARPHKFRDDDSMWNSGVLAIPLGRSRPPGRRAGRSTTRSAPPACGTSPPSSSSKGVVLGRTGRLKPAEEWFAHYWGNKPGYDAEIARRLADAFIEGMSVKEAAAKYRESPIDLPVGVRQPGAKTRTLDLRVREHRATEPQRRTETLATETRNYTERSEAAAECCTFAGRASAARERDCKRQTW